MNQKTLILLMCLFVISYQHGVHRVAQSMWNYPNTGSTTKLYLYFSLDEALPAGGVMHIALPMTFAFTTCNAWALDKDLTPPATTSGFMIGLMRSDFTGCQFYTYAATAGTLGTYGGAVALAANTAYGIELFCAGGTALTVGSYAPIAITTRSGYDASVTTGPMLGCNPAFDMVFVIAAPLGFTTTTTRIADATGCVGTACNSKKNQPSDAAMYLFSIGTWSGTADTTVITAPYNIEFSFTKQPKNGAYVYGTWSFESTATSCTSTQFGKTNTTLPTMSTVKPVCTYAANSAGLFLKTIQVTAAADDMRPGSIANWGTWVVSFTLKVTNPSDLIDTNPTLNTIIYNPTTNYIYAKSTADATTVFKVVIGARDPTTFGVPKDSTARVAFGADPMTATGNLYGAGVYSEVFCAGSAIYNFGEHATNFIVANAPTLPSNCASFDADNITPTNGYAGAGPQPARAINAIELAWTIPLAIPADTTSAVVTCQTDKTLSATTGNFRFFKIHQASLATSVSKGNCWYSSTNSISGTFWQKEIITCKDMAKVSANAILTVAFQFEIFQLPYTAYNTNYALATNGQTAYATTAGRNKDWASGKVAKTIKKLTCQMIITAGGKAWYTQQIEIPVDGSLVIGDGGDFAAYETFISQKPAAAIVLTTTTGLWGLTTQAAGTMTHIWQEEPSMGSKFDQAGTGSQDLTIALMFYIGDAYSTISGVDWATVQGRRIPMAISAPMQLKFYLYGAHTFSGSNKLKAWWQGYGTGTSGTSLISGIWQFNNHATGKALSMYFGTANVAWAADYTTGGGLNVCASDGAYDAAGLCHTITGFTNTLADAGKVLVSETKASGALTAGGFTPGAADSAVLCKACITNGAAAVQTGGNLGNMLQSCKLLPAYYFSAKGGAVDIAGSGAFYVMFAGALMNTVGTPLTNGYVSPSLAVGAGATLPYEKVDYATYHKFTYTAAYLKSGVTWMTTFRGRGGMGSAKKQGLETFFWGVKDNLTSTLNTWVISTMIHTYIAPKAAAKTNAQSMVTVSWPAWVEPFLTAVTVAIDQNDGLLFFNTMKMTVQTGYHGVGVFGTTNCAFVGTFMPRGQAFMKSTGDNQIEAVSTQSGTTCYIYGTESGESAQTKNVGATKYGHIVKDNLRIMKHGYSLGLQLDSNFLVCSVGTIAAEGVVTVIPFVNTYLTATTKHTSEFLVLVNAADWAWKLTLVIGSDKDMFFVGFYPASADIVALTDYHPEVAGNLFFTAGTPVTMIATATLTLFQVDGLDHAKFKIGATGVDSKLTCALGGSPASQNWLTIPLDLAQICGDPTYLMGANTGAVNSGATAAVTTGGTGKLCLKHTQQVKIVNNILVPQTIFTPRECWYCPMEVGGTMSWTILKFQVPVTTNRKVSGFAVQISAKTGTQIYNSPPTFGGVILTNVDTISQCGVTPASITYATLGKQVAWSVTSPTPLAGGWVVKFVGSTSAAGFFAVSDTGSTTTTCGTTVLATAQAMVQDVTGRSFIKFTLGAVAIPLDSAGNAGLLPTYAAACAGASKFTATVNNWKPTATAAAFTTGNCVILNAVLVTENTGATAQDAALGAVSMTTAGLSFDQATAGTNPDLSITAVSFNPNVAASYGRFRFQPVLGSNGAALYAGQSIFTYTFGSSTMFGTGVSVCKITDSAWGADTGAVSKCEATGSVVTIKMATSSATASFGVEIFGATGAWAQTAQDITAGLTNFGDSVQTGAATAVKLAALPTAQTVKSVVTLTKTYVNTMDLGTFMFTTTIKTTTGTFNSSQWAMIQFPTYYRADLGAGVLCNIVNKNGTNKEAIWCELMWDFTLKLWGPSINAKKFDEAFNISVMGVDNVNPTATERNFQVGISAMNTAADKIGTSMTITDDNCLMEFMTVADTKIASGWKSAATSLKVWSYISSSSETRSTTQVTITFQVPTSAEIKDVTLGYVTLHLPKMWGSVIKSTTTLTTSLSVQALTTPFAFTAIGATSPASFTGSSVTVWMADTTTKFAEGTNYTLVVGNIPTPEMAVTNGGLMYPVISVGKQTTGGLGWSDSMSNWVPTAKPTFAVKTGLTECQFSAKFYTVNQGTFAKDFCIQATGKDAKFNSDITFTIVGTVFTTAPAVLTAKQGQLKTCAMIGTSSATAQSWYWVTFTNAQTVAKYTALPSLKVQVSNTKSQITNVNEAACSLGFSSVPIKVGYTEAPFSDVIVSLNQIDKLNATITTDLVTNNPSYGLTANTGATTVTLTQLVPTGILSFKCDATMNATVVSNLWYNISGTDKASFTLQNSKVKATGLLKATAKLTTPELKLIQENTTSTASLTKLQAGCPELGTAFIWFAPSGTTKPSAATGAAAKALADAYMKSTEVAGYNTTKTHMSAQWFQIPVLTASQPLKPAEYVTATFNTVSNKTYTAMLYCFTTTEYLYQSTAALALTSKDNGGKVSNIELTYSKYFDEALHNADLLKVAGALATGVMIANDRCTDRWGGISGKPSMFVPKTAFTPQTATTVTNTTANTTTATNTTTNTTRLLATSYPVNLFIQPDPTADTATDATAWTAQISGIKTQLSAAVTTYGAVESVIASAAAPSITEAAVTFSTDPTATSNADGSSVSVAGAVAGDSYVYCAFQTTGTAAATTTRRILANTTNTTTTTTAANTTTTTPASAATTTTAAVATSMLAWSDAPWTTDYSFLRSTTTTAVPAFTQSFNTTGGSSYKWACQGTSLNPVANNAQFMTAYKEGTVTATLAVTVGAGSLFSTIAAISFIIIAAFFY